MALNLAVGKHLRVEGQGVPELGTALWLLWSIGSGAALSGLVLLVARRCRGGRFPVHPGERLLVVMSLDAWVDLLGQAFVTIYIWAAQSTLEAAVDVWYAAPFFLQTTVIGAAYFLTARRLSSPPWRWVFQCSGVAYLLYPFCCSMTPPILLSLTSNLLLIFVVTSDYQDGIQYPWTHWFGVGLRLWFTPLMLAWLVIDIFGL